MFLEATLKKPIMHCVYFDSKIKGRNANEKIYSSNHFNTYIHDKFWKLEAQNKQKWGLGTVTIVCQTQPIAIMKKIKDLYQYLLLMLFMRVPHKQRALISSKTSTIMQIYVLRFVVVTRLTIIVVDAATTRNYVALNAVIAYFLVFVPAFHPCEK